MLNFGLAAFQLHFYLLHLLWRVIGRLLWLIVKVSRWWIARGERHGNERLWRTVWTLAHRRSDSGRRRERVKRALLRFALSLRDGWSRFEELVQWNGPNARRGRGRRVGRDCNSERAATESRRRRRERRSLCARGTHQKACRTSEQVGGLAADEVGLVLHERGAAVLGAFGADRHEPTARCARVQSDWPRHLVELLLRLF